jgi:hypothetical protein
MTMADGVDEGSAAMLGSAAKCRPIGAYVHTPTYDDLVAEIARLRLTDAEREAVKRAAGFVEELAHPETSLTAAALRELLERLK